MNQKTGYVDSSSQRIKVAVHKFSSCDGCQLAFLNMGEPLLGLSQLVDIRHFAEAGMVDELAPVDVAFVEGSVSTTADVDRIQEIRNSCEILITIGACANSGGIQALRNYSSVENWSKAIYARPEYIDSLAEVSPISAHVRVDFELWGCPVSTRQITNVLRSLVRGVPPVRETDKICQECKRQNIVCVMVAKGEPCMGPVTRTGCGALCPSISRDCYACDGPATDINTDALAQHFHDLGLGAGEIARRFAFINNASEEFRLAAEKWRDDE